MRTTVLQDTAAAGLIREKARPLTDAKSLDPLMEHIGDARVVMLGEATHGTHEFYTWRSYITQRLITEKGFSFIAVEGDWPDCYRLNRYIKQYGQNGGSALQVLRSFNRWPSWMWANWETVALAEWLHRHNAALPLNKKVGFYGLDVYSLWESMEAIMQYLKKTDPAALKVAAAAYECFEPYRRDEGSGYANAAMMVPELCKDEVTDMLREIRRKRPQYDSDFEAAFSTEQNALIAVNAEKYYRAMIQGGGHSWNVRDRHMAETLDRLLNFHGYHARAVIWAHNTHIGDARATDMVRDGMFNIGELARKQYDEKNVRLIGFGTYQGSVIAGRSWGAVMRHMDVPPAREGSWEHLLQQAGPENKLLLMPELRDDMFLENHIGHRAIGVVYNPAAEKYGNYVPTILPARYDAFLYLHETSALHPLHIRTDQRQVPETYPFGV